MEVNTKYIKSLLKCCAVSAFFLFSNPSYSNILEINTNPDGFFLPPGTGFDVMFDFPELNIANNDVELSFDYGLWTSPNDPIDFTTTLNGINIGTVESTLGYVIPGKESISYSIDLSNFVLADNFLSIRNTSNTNDGKISNVVLTYTTSSGAGGGATPPPPGPGPSPVPAPATVLLMMFGILGLGMVRKSRQTTAC